MIHDPRVERYWLRRQWEDAKSRLKPFYPLLKQEVQDKGVLRGVFSFHCKLTRQERIAVHTAICLMPFMVFGSWIPSAVIVAYESYMLRQEARAQVPPPPDVPALPKPEREI